LAGPSHVVQVPSQGSHTLVAVFGHEPSAHVATHYLFSKYVVPVHAVQSVAVPPSHSAQDPSQIKHVVGVFPSG